MGDGLGLGRAQLPQPRANGHELNPLPREPFPERRRERMAVGGLQCRELRREVPCQPAANPLRCQQREEAIAHARAILSHRGDLARYLPRGLSVARGHVHHAPHLPLPSRIPQQQVHQLRRVEPIRLRAARAAIHLDTRGIHHEVGDAARRQPPVQPEPIAPRLVTGVHRRVDRETEARLRRQDLALQCGHISSRDRAKPRALRDRCRERQDPLRTPQLKSQIQHGLGCGTLRRTGRLSHQLLLRSAVKHVCEELTAAALLFSAAATTRGLHGICSRSDPVVARWPASVRTEGARVPAPESVGCG